MRRPVASNTKRPPCAFTLHHRAAFGEIQCLDGNGADQHAASDRRRADQQRRTGIGGVVQLELGLARRCGARCQHAALRLIEPCGSFGRSRIAARVEERQPPRMHPADRRPDRPRAAPSREAAARARHQRRADQYHDLGGWLRPASSHGRHPPPAASSPGDRRAMPATERMTSTTARGRIVHSSS